MGIFSTIGSFFGPIGSAVGSVGDAFLGHSQAKKEARRANAAEMNKFVRLRDASERAGYHPLETLRAGGSVGQVQAPRLISSLVASNAFDALENEISGEGARQRKRAEVDDEIRERQLENLRISNEQRVARQSINSATVTSNRPPRLTTGDRMRAGTPFVPTDQGDKKLSDIANPTPTNPDGTIDPSIDDGGTGAVLKPREKIVTTNGGTMNVTVGPDIDEVITGGAAEVLNDVRDRGLDHVLKEMTPDMETTGYRIRGGERRRLGEMVANEKMKTINQKPPIQWDSRFGTRKPRAWSQWDNKQKMRWIVRKNKK